MRHYSFMSVPYTGLTVLKELWKEDFTIMKPGIQFKPMAAKRQENFHKHYMGGT